MLTFKKNTKVCRRGIAGSGDEAERAQSALKRGDQCAIRCNEGSNANGSKDFWSVSGLQESIDLCDVPWCDFL